MKKSLIALAVLGAFAGAAAAQSSATLYGMIDMGYGVGNNGTYEGQKGVESKFQQWGNSNSTSRWGLKGQEDLGNGMAVYFNLESKIDPEDGDTGKKLFDRAAIVGVKGAFGAIQAGRQTTVMNNVLGKYDITGSPNLTSSLGNTGLSAISQTTTGSRVDSALAYVSPNFGGFSFQAAYIAKNDAVGVDKSVYTVGADFATGPFSIGAAYESKLADGMDESWGVGAKLDFGSFVVSGGWMDNHIEAAGNGFYLGAAVPFGAFTVGAQYAWNMDIDGITTGTETIWVIDPFTGQPVNAGWKELTDDVDPQAWEIFAKYKLSDRTQLYAQYGGVNKDGKSWLGAERKYSASLGIMHKF